MLFRPSSESFFNAFFSSPFPLAGVWKRVLAGVSISLAMQGIALAAPIDPTGLWYTTGEDSIIKIAPCQPPVAGTATAPGAATTYCGTLVWLKEPLEDGKPKVDHENPDKSKRTIPMIGIQLLTELTADKNHWRGKAYNPEDGKTYDITFQVLPAKGHEKEKLPGDSAEIEGCILKILCKTDGFTRAHSIPGQPDAVATPAAPKPAATKAGKPTAH